MPAPRPRPPELGTSARFDEECVALRVAWTRCFVSPPPVAWAGPRGAASSETVRSSPTGLEVIAGSEAPPPRGHRLRAVRAYRMVPPEGRADIRMNARHSAEARCRASPTRSWNGPPGATVPPDVGGGRLASKRDGRPPHGEPTALPPMIARAAGAVTKHGGIPSRASSVPARDTCPRQS